MVNQCMNINCSKRHQPIEYESHCFTCRHPLASTPDYGSSLSTTSTPYIHPGPFSYGHASPATSASFYNSPAGYSPSAPNPPAFPIPRGSPVILHQSYPSPGYISTTVLSHKIFALVAIADTQLHRLNQTFILTRPISQAMSPIPDSIQILKSTTNRIPRRR